MTAKARILIIDDSEVVLSELKHALEGAGYEVSATSQTVGAGRFLRATDLVILDYHMPGMDGSHVLGSLRAASEKLDTKPLFYLYTTDRGVAASYKRLGFDGAFTDKGDAASLLRQLQAALRLLRLQRKPSNPTPA